MSTILRIMTGMLLPAAVLLFSLVPSLVPAPVEAADTVRIGVLSYRQAEQTLFEWEPLQRALTEAIPGRQFMIEALDYPSLEAAVASQRLDFVLTNPAHYILLLRRHGLSAPLVTRIALHEEQEVEVFGGVIVARADRADIQTLTDLGGRSIAYVDRDSLGGFRMQAFELMDAGFPSLVERHLVATGMPHDQVITAVLSGQVDVGFVRSGLVESMVSENRLDPAELRIINRQQFPGLPFAVSTRLYPEWPLAALPHADPELSRRVAAALLMLKEDSERAAALGIGGFTVPSDYSLVEDMLRALRVAPFDSTQTVSLADIWTQYRREAMLLAVLFVIVLAMLMLLLVKARQLRALLVRVSDLHEIVGRSPVVAMAWRNEPGWPISFVSDNVDQFGYQAEDFTSGRLDFASLIHPEDLERVQGEVASYIAEGPDQYAQEYRIRHGHGHWIWVDDYTWLTRDSGGKVLSIHGVLLDITDRKLAEREAAHSRHLLSYVIEHSRSAVAVHDRDLRYVYVSQKYLQTFGIRDADIIGKHHYEVFPDLPQKWRDVHQRVLRGEVHSADEDPFPREDGQLDWSSWECRPWYEADGAIGGLIIYTEIITERKQVELNLREKSRALVETNSRLAQLATVFTHAREGVIITDARGDIIEVNEAFSRITGYPREEAIGRNPRLFGSGRHSPDFFTSMWQQLKLVGYWSGEIWNRRKNGEIYPQQATISAVRDEEGVVFQYVALLTDVTEEKRSQRELEYVSQYDPLTNLPNRRLLTSRLKRAMDVCRRHDRVMAVVFLDLDDFRAVNDRFGTEVGDRLLRELAQRINSSLAAGDTAARLGGDELVVLLTDLDSEARASGALEQLLELSQQPFNLQETPIRLSASLGVTFFSREKNVDADQLLREADQAMYQAKLAGKNRCHRFNAEQDQATRSLHETQQRIAEGLSRNEFLLYYQPKVNMRTGQVLGAEALVRWQHPERGLLAPAQFLPLIEDHPLALELGAWVIETALEQLSVWKLQGLDLIVSVNVFGRQLQQEDFVDSLQEALRRHAGILPEQLEIEVLETSALEDMDKISRLIQRCQELGVRCALDDFGTGYSSLTYLKRLPASILKIDQSFVRDMLDDPEYLTILNGILGLSRAFQREAVAEGVETVAHGDILLDLGCELGQGYGIARPMPAGDFREWMAGWKPSRSWRGRRPRNAEQVQAIFAGVEHRAWVSAIAAHVQDAGPMPAVATDACGFGRWLDDNEHFAGCSPDQALELKALHERMHAFAEHILALKQDGKSGQARSELAGLFSLRDRLLAVLDRTLAGFSEHHDGQRMSRSALDEPKNNGPFET